MAKVVRRADNESIDHMLLRFRRAVKSDGTMDEVKKRESYTAPSLARKKKRLKAEKARNKRKH